ncbi:hypothetical protein HGRIS_009835 [Hohenbuehelia grisea]|uniref:Uncharacterized protein n=1 Tax=Hohenbuehelia grisea TaxID=104357 RepID=A0ABR3J2S4_9AGAR
MHSGIPRRQILCSDLRGGGISPTFGAALWNIGYTFRRPSTASKYQISSRVLLENDEVVSQIWHQSHGPDTAGAHLFITICSSIAGGADLLSELLTTAPRLLCFRNSSYGRYNDRNLDKATGIVTSTPRSIQQASLSVSSCATPTILTAWARSTTAVWVDQTAVATIGGRHV